jgi:glutamate racemase
MSSADPRAGLPIAMFDSGVGGLTVLHECLVSLPEEDYVYLGDDARFPYGARSAPELRAHVEEVSRFLLDRGAKLLVIACNSAASAGEEAAREVAAEAGVEVVAVIRPEAEIAAALTQTGNVGVLATPATVRSGAYLRALAGQQRALRVTEVEAPDLAAVIQRGFPFDEGVVEMVRSYCAPLKRAEVDTVILGCTHYPLVAPMLQRVLGRDVRLVSAGHAIAATAQRVLEEAGLEKRQAVRVENPGKQGSGEAPGKRDSDEKSGNQDNDENLGDQKGEGPTAGGQPGSAEGTYRFMCTGDPAGFKELGTRFLQMPLGDVERVDLP